MSVARRERLDALAVGLLVGCCALWGVNQVVIKTTLPLIPPMQQAALRSLIAAGLLLAFARGRGIALFPRDGCTRSGVAAGVLFGLEFVCVYIGLQFTTASRVVVFLYLAPFVVAAGMPFISRAERLAPLQLAGLVAAFGALAFAFQEGFAANAPQQWIGDTLAIASGVLWGLTTLVVRATALTHASPERTLFYQLAFSVPVLGAASLLTGEALPPAPGTLALASVLFQSVVIAFASYLGWFWLLRHYPATRLSSFTFLTPMFGLLSGALLLGEPVSARLLLALSGIAVGIWLVNRR